MKILGLDFTSVPSSAKPITLAEGQCDGKVLNISGLSRLESFKAFEDTLISTGPWVAGIDFPFGQSRRFVENVQWPLVWSRYVELVAGLSRPEFRDLLEAYKEGRSVGDKEHLRSIDALCGGQSPQKLYGVPVALMFYEGAPRLLRSGASIVPVRPNSDDRVVVEAYPALVARALCGSAAYKPAEDEQKDAATDTRRRMVTLLSGSAFRQRYEIDISLTQAVRDACIADPTGDTIDAVFAAVQAARAYGQRSNGYGVPEDCDVVEGWIPDPLSRPSLNSSLTRVRPFFQRLIQRDQTGESWMSRLLSLADARVPKIGNGEPFGRLLDQLVQRQPFVDKIRGAIELERCFEFPAPASERFLRWLIDHPESLSWPRKGKEELRYSPVTQGKREDLLGRNGSAKQSAAANEARAALAASKGRGVVRRWWAFEGTTEIDCCLQTDSMVLVIEGKRTETLSDSTDWYSGRNQLFRNLEAARDLASGQRQFAVLVIAENPLPASELGDPDSALPHLSPDERADLMTHFLGVITWQQACDATGVNFTSLPKSISRRVKKVES